MDKNEKGGGLMDITETLIISEWRQHIHDLCIRSRTTGLSPPEQELLDKLEGQELLQEQPGTESCRVSF